MTDWLSALSQAVAQDINPKLDLWLEFINSPEPGSVILHWSSCFYEQKSLHQLSYEINIKYQQK